MTTHETNIAEHRRRVRRLALQMLYQIDAQDGTDIEGILMSVFDAADDPQDHFDGPWKVAASADIEEHREGFARAQGAWASHAEADQIATKLSPLWPTHRQPAVDRNIIRLCWFEMTVADIPPKVAVNEAVELGKIFSTERSGQFLNGVLDKILKQVLAGTEPVASIESNKAAPENSTD